eukprot:2130969-Amphidinium_carterae.1
MLKVKDARRRPSTVCFSSIQLEEKATQRKVLDTLCGAVFCSLGVAGVLPGKLVHIAVISTANDRPQDEMLISRQKSRNYFLNPPNAPKQSLRRNKVRNREHTIEQSSIPGFVT